MGCLLYNPRRVFYTGNIEVMANYAGKSVNDIHDIPRVPKLIERIWKEFLNE